MYKIPIADWAITSICFQLIVDEASITQGTEKVVIATERHHQNGARNDIYGLCMWEGLGGGGDADDAYALVQTCINIKF